MLWLPENKRGYGSVIENVAGRIATELEGGDRGAFNTNDSGHAVFHASDIEAGTFVYHKNPNVPGDVLGSYIFVASQIGAVLDTDLSSGGGTNDTSPLQDILNIAAGGSRVLLIMDGPALVSGLDVYGNTTIYCMEGAGFYLANGSNREVVRNANRSRTTITDEHISLIGGYYNANHTGQTGAGSTGHQQTDETFMNGISMFGVNYLDIRGVTVANPMGFGINTGNANYVNLHDIRIDAGSSPHLNQDGIHLNGPQSYVYISNSKIYSYDDAIAINAGDDNNVDITAGNIHGPYVGQGLISNVIIDGVEFVGSLRGIRFLSHDGNSRIDQVSISNVTGSVAWVGVWCSPESAGNGDIGTISIDGWNVRQLSDAHSDRASMYWTGYIDRLLLHNIEIYQPIDTRPVIYFHTGFVGQSVTIDGFHDYDSASTGGTPINVKGHIVRFDGSNLSWVRNVSSRGTALILLDNAASRIEFVTLDGVIVDNVNFVFSQTAGTVPTSILAANINHLVPSTNATISTTGGTITDVCISNWYGYSPFSGTATTTRGDAFGIGSTTLNDLSDVNTSGEATGDVLYDNAGTWIPYPLGIGTRITVSGSKIRFGNVTGGNYLEIDSITGTLKLIGNATAWDDMRISADVVKAGATAPNWKAFGPSGNIQALMFEAGHHDEAMFAIQLPHQWKEGSKIYPHVHWTPTTTDAGNVVWELEYIWANINGTFGAPSNMATDATAAGGTAWVHKLTDLKSGGNKYIDGTGKTMSSMLMCRIHRNSNSGSDTLNKDVALLEIDFHYEIDSFGSDTADVKDTSSSLLLESGDILLLESGDRLLTE